MKKPRSDAKLLNLLPEEQERIYVWMTEGVEGDTSYDKVLEQIYLDFGVRSSKAALTTFWRRVVAPRKLRQSAQAAGTLVDSAEDSGVVFEGAAKEMLRQKTFEILADPETDPKTLAVFYGLMADSQKIALKHKEVAIKERRVTLLEEQAAKAKAALERVKSKGGLTQDALREIEEAASLL